MGSLQSVILQAYGMDKTIFTTLLILVAVRATEVEQRVENERLRAEIHSLRAMNGHLLAKNKIKTLDADCFITTSVLGMIKSRFRPTGTPDHPRWSFNYTTSEFGVSPPELEEVTVECPCSAADGQTLDQETALRNILGQAAQRRSRVHQQLVLGGFAAMTM